MIFIMILSMSSNNHEKIQILFEDEYICVINKAAGILSVPSQGAKQRSALGILEEIMRKNGTYSAKHRPFAVHRLDRDTSGVMMFALSENAQKKIMDSWHQMVSERLYHAVAENPKNPRQLLPLSGLIDDDLAFNARNVGYVPKKSDEKSEFEKKPVKTTPARTHFKILLQGKSHTLFELSLDTGKKNQIRAHLASKGYPLAGDKNFRAKTDYFNRLCLHACTLEFTHPYTGKKMRFEAAEPEEWKIYVEKGDLHPESPEWRGSQRGKDSKKDAAHFGQRPLSGKEKAHMDFISRGKAHR